MTHSIIRRFTTLLFVILCAGGAHVRADEPSFKFDAKEERFTSPVDQTQQTYLVQEWNKGEDKNVGPLLVIYLHGAGGNQTQGVSVGAYNNLFGKLGQWLSKRNAVYICPEYRGNSWMGPAAEKDVVEIFRLAKEKYRPSRILLTGASMGGTSTLIFASLHPDLMDGIIAWCPATDPAAMFPKFPEHFRAGYGGSPEQVPDVFRERTSRDRAKELAKLPSVIIHGKADTVIPVEHSRVLVERLKDLKANVKYIEVEGGHDTPLAEDPVPSLEWLLAQASAKHPNAVGRHIMFFEYGNTPNRFVELDAGGKITWQFPTKLAVIFQVLGNGNVLYAEGGQPTGVFEVNRKGETVWKYLSKSPQVLACERLPDGNTLIAEQAPCQAVEVNAKGEVVHITPLKSTDPAFHRQVRCIHKLKDGHILAAHESDGAAREYAPDGKVVWEYPDAENTCDAIRLDNGNTLVACGTKKRIVEVTPDGKVAWSFGASDAPELNLTTIYSLQVLKNGNYLVGNFLRGAEGKGVHAFEVTHDKKVVWTFADHARFKSIMSIRAPEE